MNPIKPALTNPYEITCNNVTVKCSPFGIGQFVSDRDLFDLGEVDLRRFKMGLYRLYDVEQAPDLMGIKILGKKSTQTKGEVK